MANRDRIATPATTPEKITSTIGGMIRPTTDKEPTMTITAKPASPRTAAQILDELDHWMNVQRQRQVSARARISHLFTMDTSTVARDETDALAKAEAFAAVAREARDTLNDALMNHLVGVDVVAAVQDHAADATAYSHDVQQAAAWGAVLRITLGKW